MLIMGKCTNRTVSINEIKYKGYLIKKKNTNKNLATKEGRTVAQLSIIMG
jgi:hypothetical protein